MYPGRISILKGSYVMLNKCLAKFF